MKERAWRFHVVIEGLEEALRVPADVLPRCGEWLNLRHDKAWWWFPVLEVIHALPRSLERGGNSEAKAAPEDVTECVVVSSLALGVRVELHRKEEAYKLVLPPPRWPLGGRLPDGPGGFPSWVIRSQEN